MEGGLKKRKGRRKTESNQPNTWAVEIGRPNHLLAEPEPTWSHVAGHNLLVRGHVLVPFDCIVNAIQLRRAGGGFRKWTSADSSSLVNVTASSTNKRITYCNEYWLQKHFSHRETEREETPRVKAPIINSALLVVFFPEVENNNA
ncbi:hypothetical protein SDJN02_04514, partial [Cucurbita argyrosperma subsp. argyrosperma]